MKIGIIGTGYVGLPTGVGLAELGNTVVCVDKLKEKIDSLKQGKVTLYEEGLEELFQKNTFQKMPLPRKTSGSYHCSYGIKTGIPLRCNRSKRSDPPKLPGTGHVV